MSVSPEIAGYWPTIRNNNKHRRTAGPALGSGWKILQFSEPSDSRLAKTSAQLLLQTAPLNYDPQGLNAECVKVDGCIFYPQSFMLLIFQFSTLCCDLTTPPLRVSDLSWPLFLSRLRFTSRPCSELITTKDVREQTFQTRSHVSLTLLHLKSLHINCVLGLNLHWCAWTLTLSLKPIVRFKLM